MYSCIENNGIGVISSSFVGIFQNIVRLLDCDVMISILKLTLHRALNEQEPRCSVSGQVVKVLHLVGYGLHEELRAQDAETTDEPGSQSRTQFLQKAKDAGIFHTLEELRTEEDDNEYMSLLKWVQDRYAELIP